MCYYQYLRDRRYKCNISWHLLLNEAPIPLLYKVVKCSTRSVLHHNHQRFLVDKVIIVCYDVGMLQHTENSDLIGSRNPLLSTKVIYRNLLDDNLEIV